MSEKRNNYKDLTLNAVQKQLSSFGVKRFEVGVKKADGTLVPRVWQKEQVISSISWLKVQNRQGSDIFIRPEGSQGIILMDDLSKQVLAQIKLDGLTPACIVESSPSNYQAWIRVSDTAIPSDLGTAYGQYLAFQYGGDMNSADWRHYGRLAGFTNRKPEHVNSKGMWPFVLLVESKGRTINRPDTLLQSVLVWKKNRESQVDALVNEKRIPSNIQLKVDADQFFISQLASLKDRYGSSFNASKGDWAIAKRMMILGYSKESIALALRRNSPLLSDRKKGHIEHYIELTLSELEKRFGNKNIDTRTN